jgi:hypothetical protein
MPRYLRVVCQCLFEPFYSQRQGGRLTKHKRVISRMQGVWLPGCKGSVPGMQGDGFASEPGGIMDVAVGLCLPLLLGL